MRAKLEQLIKTSGSKSFLVYEVVAPSFEFYWHYHPEYELTYIVKGKGNRLVGDSYEPFSEGDFILIGPNVPHTWVSDKEKNSNGIAIVIHFSTSFMEPLLAYPEFGDIKKLLQKANSGLKFLPTKKSDAIEQIRKIKSLHGIQVMTSLFQMLDALAAEKAKSLSSSRFIPAKGEQNEKRINRIFQYVQKGFRDKLSLEEAAKGIHLSVSAFCKFFKRVSGKTFSDYVNEVRVAHACTLLVETDKPISAIAVECGFENLAYFNRVFLRKTNMRPGSYRRL